MKLSEWARKQGVSYVSAHKWFKAGKLPVKATQLASGTILIADEVHQVEQVEKVCIYGRVSSSVKKDDLERQVERCLAFAAARGYSVDTVYKEIASGMNDKRIKLIKMLDSRPTKIIVEHKDRLTRFGFNYLENLLKKLGCEIVVINRDSEDESDLMKDFVAIITSFCCRLYGLRRGRSKTVELKKQLLEK